MSQSFLSTIAIVRPASYVLIYFVILFLLRKLGLRGEHYNSTSVLLDELKLSIGVLLILCD